MVNKKYEYLVGHLAEEQLSEIIDYYEGVKNGMGIEFLLSFEQALDLLSTNPNTRRCLSNVKANELKTLSLRLILSY